MKKVLIQLLTGIFVGLSVAYLYIAVPDSFQSIDNKLRDYMFLIRGPIETTGEVAIIDIDERSLGELGQWPWERYKVAKILQNLTEAGVGIVGMDIVFAEPDNSNPSKVLRDIGMEVTDDIPDYDLTFAQTVANTPTILGYVFNMENDNLEQKEGPMIPAIYIEQNKDEREFLLEPYRPILNIPIVQDNSFSSGFFNPYVDEDGLVRSVPLAMKYDMVVYPSLSFEMMRVAHQEEKVFVNYDPEIGVENITVGDTIIPTDRFGKIFVNYRGPSYTFPYFSAVDLYNGDFDPKDIEGKFLLFGTSAAGLLDLRAMPFDSVYPGVEIHANVIDNILMGDFISKPSWILAADLATIVSVPIILALVFAFASAVVSLLVLVVATAGIAYFNYYMLFTEGIIFNNLFVLISIMSVFIFSIVINYFLETKQKNLIKGKFATKVSPAVMEDLLKNSDGDVFAAMEKEITVFFSDVRNFTNISEAMGNAKNLIDFMNEYMDPMTDIIIETGGTVDKFIGDAIMAYWNAPADVKNHADQALIATLNQLHRVELLNVEMRKDPRFAPVVEMSDRLGKPIVDIGIGLNSGVAIVGEMGSSSRADYTCIGDPINLGARLESLCKYYNSKCNISNFTKDLLTGEYIYRFLDLVTVKGKSEPIEIWQVHDYEHGKDGQYIFDVTRERLQEELDYYHRAIDLYKEAKFEEALEIFKDINSWDDKTNVNIYDMYIERCKHYIEVPPKDFNGVFVHTTKG